jgi:mannose-6-phosphate isomerase
MEQEAGNRDSFTIYMCVDGKAEISNEAGTASIQKGETILLPANSETIRIQTSGCKLLEVTL